MVVHFVIIIGLFKDIIAFLKQMPLKTVLAFLQPMSIKKRVQNFVFNPVFRISQQVSFPTGAFQP